MKANPDKCHLLLSKDGNFEANINESRISNTKFEKLLGVTFDNRLTLITTFPTFTKQTVIKSMHSLEFLTTWIKTKREYFLIHTSCLSLITVP